MKKINWKLMTACLVSVLVLAFWVQPGTALDQENQQAKKKPKYVPGELIVKFKPNVGAYAGDYFTRGRPLRVLSGTTTLDSLNHRYGATKVERVFMDLEIQGQKEGKAFLTAQEVSDRVRAKFPERAFRALEDEEVKKALKSLEARGVVTEHDLLMAQRLNKKMQAKFLERSQQPVESIKVPDLENIYVLELDPEVDVEAVAREYRKDPSVVYAHPNYILEPQYLPNDPFYYTQGTWGQSYEDMWGVKKIQAEDVWDITKGGNVVIAFVDSGLDFAHEDLRGNMWKNTREIPNNGRDDDGNGYIDDYYGCAFLGPDDPGNGHTNVVRDDHGHSTATAGLAAAVGDNNKGIIGVAPRANIMIAKAIGDFRSAARAIRYATDAGARIINNSYGGLSVSQEEASVMADAVRYAHVHGVINLASAGNNNANVGDYCPANIPEVIAVGATMPNDQRYEEWIGGEHRGSNFGPKLDLVAPGWDHLTTRAEGMGNPSTWVAGNYVRAFGATSAACPHASGAVALLLSKYPWFSLYMVRLFLWISADDVGPRGRDDYFGWGRLNIGRCFSLLNKNYNSSYFVSQSFPQWIVRGQSFQVRIRFRNNGLTTWMRLARYRLGSQNPENNGTWGLGRVELPGPVAPGKECEFRFTVRAPSQAGVYNFQWRIVWENHFWFGAKSDNIKVVIT